MKNKYFKLFRLLNPEAAIWILGITSLYFFGSMSGSHFTICPIKNLGFDFCPGCGLGASIHYLFHLDFVRSFHAHPLGIFALAILIYRIVILFENQLILFKDHLNSN